MTAAGELLVNQMQSHQLNYFRKKRIRIISLFLEGEFMGLIQWKKEYTVGIKKLDNQHKEIIKILNQIFKLQEKGKDEKEIERILGNLQDYIKEHFRTEEEYMLKYQYPGYEEQKKEHNQIIYRLCEFHKEYLK